ncbi:hypothetical protein NEMBOFW57_007171 [Staphylotrichum longicolle]|uniref:PAS domain-containing protein n=1 Tax=Staphylotrichum longicolle TaxID=669026 RepID=A0AAD4I085_9PEZI|nr:hypothetical protein NEMBOFW57_007171 [Staphylotrichum longicolle]
MNLTPEANILFASDSLLDILGYQLDEVRGRSAFDYFHPEEVLFAHSVHSRGVLLDKAAVLHYARILSRSCQWIRRIFSSSPRDPRYRMLEHLSPKFKMPPMEREPRAALILNRFTRDLTIMYATDAVAQILGVRFDELLGKPFYECIQSNCLDEAEKCLESAKTNESIAYLRFWYKDPRADPNDSVNEMEKNKAEMEDEGDDKSSANDNAMGVEYHALKEKCIYIDEKTDPRVQTPDNGSGDEGQVPSGGPPVARTRRHRLQAPRTIELEAVVSCTSDGLVVVLRRARPPIPDLQTQVMPAAFDYEDGLFAAPWALQPIKPHISPDLLYTFRPPLLPQYMPLRECVKAVGGPPSDQLMRSIRDVAVFAWAVTGINPNLAHYGHGRRRIDGQPDDGVARWEPNNSLPSTYPPAEVIIYTFHWETHARLPKPTSTPKRTRSSSENPEFDL